MSNEMISLYKEKEPQIIFRAVYFSQPWAHLNESSLEVHLKCLDETQYSKKYSINCFILPEEQIEWFSLHLNLNNVDAISLVVLH